MTERLSWYHNKELIDKTYNILRIPYKLRRILAHKWIAEYKETRGHGGDTTSRDEKSNLTTTSIDDA